MLFSDRLVAAIGLMACLGLVAVGAASQTQTGGEPPAIPEDARALEGVPEVRLDVTREGATRRTLDQTEAAAHSLSISIVDGKYYWSGRADRPLTLTSADDFTYLSSSAEPGRYVRFRRVDDGIAYVEHVDMAWGSVTYWGELRIVLGK